MIFKKSSFFISKTVEKFLLTTEEFRFSSVIKVSQPNISPAFFFIDLNEKLKLYLVYVYVSNHFSGDPFL